MERANSTKKSDATTLRQFELRFLCRSFLSLGFEISLIHVNWDVFLNLQYCPNTYYLGAKIKVPGQYIIYCPRGKYMK